MLRQHNFQISKPKRRKLYTPLSDEEENIETEIQSKKVSEKVETEIIKNCPVNNTTKASNSKIDINEYTVKELDPDEIAENLTWNMIKPMLRKNPVLLKSIWQHFLKLNPIEKANKFTIPHKRAEKNNVNFNQIVNVVTMTSSIKSKGHSNNKQQLNASFKNTEEQQEKSGHSSKNQFNSVVEVQQPVNGFSIKAIPSAINCSALSSIFTQHEISKENQNIEQINSSIKDDFIASQFVNSRISNLKDETTNDSVNHDKLLIDPNQILNEWLKNSPPNRLQLTESDEDIPKTSLLSESGKKILHNESLSKCFL